MLQIQNVMYQLFKISILQFKISTHLNQLINNILNICNIIHFILLVSLKMMILVWNTLPN